MMMLFSSLRLIRDLILATTRVSFWAWISPTRDCRLGQDVAFWFQHWKSTARISLGRITIGDNILRLFFPCVYHIDQLIQVAASPRNDVIATVYLIGISAIFSLRWLWFYWWESGLICASALGEKSSFEMWGLSFPSKLDWSSYTVVHC